MAPELKELLDARHWPARLTVEQTAWVLGMRAHDIPVLIAAKLLKPLGSPCANSVKYFSSVEVNHHRADRRWLSRCTDCLYQYWRKRKGRNFRSLPPPEDEPGVA